MANRRRARITPTDSWPELQPLLLFSDEWSCPCGAPPGDEKRAAAGIVATNGRRACGRLGSGATSPQTSVTRVSGGTTDCGSSWRKHAQQNLRTLDTPSGPFPEGAVDVVHARCCGLDIHKKLVVACLITPG